MPRAIPQLEPKEAQECLDRAPEPAVVTKKKSEIALILIVIAILAVVIWLVTT